MVKSSTPPTPVTRKPSKVEGIKERSNFLREPVATEILQDTTHFTEEAIQILKFHGSYQQDNRDNRIKGQEKDYQFMVRTKNPGGFVPAQLYLTLDKLAEEYGNQTLRVTTRQGFQMHGILKRNLKSAIAAIIKSMGSTLGACGDINRNVMAPPAPFKNKPEYQHAWQYSEYVAQLLSPQTGAYYEIWLDGEKAISAEENPEVVAARQKNGTGTVFHDSEEPLYGTHYMPRKFKCSVTVPGDNSVDLFSQDLTLVVITNDKQEVEGFNIYAGGGLGRTHGKEETFARLADPIGYIAKADVYDAIKAIVATQRDYGDRTDRRHARLKYLIHDWGVDKFRSMVEKYLGKPLEASKPLPEWKYEDFLGWHEQGDGKLFLGISVENGRIKDEGSFRLRTALREIVQQYNLSMRLTPHHNVILCDIAPDQKQAIANLLVTHGVEPDPNAISQLVRYSMACPALPTCGLATTESERIMPSVLQRIEVLLNRLGLSQEHFVVRMTGCPNGCARPYMAELGFVGNGPSTYQLWLGADANQTRLAQVYIEKLPLDNLEAELEPLLVYFKQSRQPNESFGDFCDRIGFDSLREFTSKYEFQGALEPEIALQDDGNGEQEAAANAATAAKARRRITLREPVYAKLKATAESQGKPMTQLVNEAIEAFLQGQ
ncbi:sulfite reductase, ferredoxin dependent [Chroococcidiopsis sp. CCALA 051]|uniref:sulfite reductase, ferredoxin dependent n=1 Tax=Chroococcidiopsis sp. CCALA 051 TaxID=869949 RepID=UPI000D0D6F25|nr:sulfite reductase, ferredoxin dependent [Chroococcidiopsis sp. CCALA 051]MBE9016413.1 sulfite reductase, ferredoxin dependent [Chroococcidiopsidales cyanobacterium LEGE 13417]PSM48863.1 sulfite reductase, ferredoxin dependent [Chroococcidiopsis sp. CCALA 051]